MKSRFIKYSKLYLPDLFWNLGIEVDGLILSGVSWSFFKRFSKQFTSVLLSKYRRYWKYEKKKIAYYT